MESKALAWRAGSGAGGGGIPSPASDARKESDGDGDAKKVATGSNDAAWDEDEEALGALIYKASRAAKARDEAIIGKKSRASKDDEAPARSTQEDRRKESGETSVMPRASSSSATLHDADEEALGALIYKNSRTAKARAQAKNGKTRHREKPPSGSDEGKPPRKKRRRKAKEEGESSREKRDVPGSSTRPRRGAAIKAVVKLSRSGSGEQRETSVTRARPRGHVVAIEAATKISGHMVEEDGGSDDDESSGYDSDSSGVTSKRPYRSGHRRNGNKGTPLKPEERNNQYWNEKYEQLKAYRADHGHCNVPQRYGNDPQLGRWVKKQRYLYKKGKLSGDRIQLLDDIEFEWNAERNMGRFNSDDELWGERLEQLRAYKAENGDCNVPKRYALLGKWVQWQRYLYKKGKLADERKERLEEIGFNWVGDKKGGSTPNNEQWEERLKQVRAYKAEHGDCKVRQKYEVDGSKLGVWVMTQRQEYKNGNLADERKERLEEIGFEWTVGRGNRNRTAKGKTGGTKSKVAAKEGTASSCSDESKPGGQEKRNRKTRERSSQSIAVGDVGYIFRKRFDGVWYEGKVVKIWRGEHRRCVYTDGDAEDLSLSQLRALAKEERDVSNSTEERPEEEADPDRPKSIEDVWNDKCERLKEFYDKHGHWNIHPSYRVDGFLLASWANIQIQACKRGQLSKARQQKLKAIGFRLAGNSVSGRKGLKKRKADKIAEESVENSDAGSSCDKEDDSSRSRKTPPEEIEPLGVGDAVLAYYLYSCGKKGAWIDATITNVNTHSENGAEWATYDVEYNDGYTDDHLPDSKIRRCPPPEDNGKEEDSDGEEEAAEEKRATRSRHRRVAASTNRREERAAARKKRTARNAPAGGDSDPPNEEEIRPVPHDDARTRKQIKEDALWSEKFEQLLASKTEHGHCNVTASCDGDNHLGEWVEGQRQQYELWEKGERSELTDERVAMLESIDFALGRAATNGRSRNKTRQKVADKKQTAGPEEPRKARTVASAPRERPGRSAAKRAAAKLFCKESDEISNANNDIDSSDPPRKRRPKKEDVINWYEQLEQLRAYKKKHGDCNVPNHGNDPQLARWVSKQRQKCKGGKLSNERKELLDQIGFCWTINSEWTERFELLRAYKKKHGHCNVPHKYPENPQLANWTRYQQSRRKQGKLADDRIELLDGIGFDWGDERNRNERWDDHFALLRAYKKKHGHCNVRRHDRVKGIALGHWAAGTTE